jgi:hypothetical protein
VADELVARLNGRGAGDAFVCCPSTSCTDLAGYLEFVANLFGLEAEDEIFPDHGHGAYTLWERVMALRIVIPIVAIVALTVHLSHPALALDSFSLGAIVLGLLPWLGAIIKSIELPGGAKFELQALEQKIDTARGAAESADQKADLALAARATGITMGAESQPDKPQSTLASLSERYNKVRASLKPGDERTIEMTAIVNQMIAAARRERPTDLLELLRSPDRGQRLAGYAAAYADSDPRVLSELVASVTRREDKPFGQYWGLQAVRRVAERETHVPHDVIALLQEYAKAVPRGTDREYEVMRILEQAGHGASHSDASD